MGERGSLSSVSRWYLWDHRYESNTKAATAKKTELIIEAFMVKLCWFVVR
jgi:hypothetical protein